MLNYKLVSIDSNIKYGGYDVIWVDFNSHKLYGIWEESLEELLHDFYNPNIQPEQYGKDTIRILAEDIKSSPQYYQDYFEKLTDDRYAIVGCE
ncbi:hypothetical protein FOD75_11455 (plasmid) [Limosilactobacillus reuteri]|uniref:Uncharacterized protein n=1 Tax=Limosilactobacillus reuteri TaxID=1598 RepID=A0A517D8M5_LIMRT|nr:hypothetical protein [Limosilactobacillus reuteri]QDR73699.1 hypothetical protein FOD75_11455 [Limosilactobacillus reuteri]